MVYIGIDCPIQTIPEGIYFVTKYFIEKSDLFYEIAALSDCIDTLRMFIKSGERY